MAHDYPKFAVVQAKPSADMYNGDFYRCNVFSETVADNGILAFFMKTKQPGIALSFEAEAGGLSLVQVFEAASLETAGTDTTVFNQNRISDKTSTATISEGSSFSNGSVVFEDVIGHSTQGNATGGGEAHVNQIILAGSEHYVVCLQNLSGGATNGYLSLNYTDVT